MKRMILILCIAVACMFISCTKENSDGNSGTADTDRSDGVSDRTRNVTEKPTETMTLDVVGSQGGTASNQPEPSKPPLPGKDFLLVRRSSEPVSPEDLVIGALHNLYTESGKGPVYTAIERFLRALAEGRLVEEDIEAGSRQDLYRLLSHHFQEDNLPNRYRIGEIIVEGTSGRADIRLIGNPGRAAGQIVCVENDGRWYISDFQIDLAELKEPYEVEGPYEPNVYRWIHQY